MSEIIEINLITTDAQIPYPESRQADKPPLGPSESEPAPTIVSRDFHFCGKCGLMYESLESYIIHKLKKDQYKMVFQPTEEIPDLWLPKLIKNVENVETFQDEVENVDNNDNTNLSTSNPEHDDDDSGLIEEEYPLFSCHDCDAKFLSEDVLRLHRVSHSQPYYNCSECGSRFSSKGNLCKHYFVVHKVKKDDV